MSDSFDAIKRDPEEIVSIADSLGDITDIFTYSDRVVRGIRGPEDIAYNELLMKKTGLETIAKEKGYYLQVPQSHIDISSTTNKIILQNFLKEYGYIPPIYRKIFGNEVYRKLKETNFIWKARDITTLTQNKIKDNIEKYFAKLELV